MLFRGFLLSILLSCFVCAAARADNFIEWQTANLQLLKGWDYAVGEKGRTVVTFEYANRWTYGDYFMFVDATRNDSGGSFAYAELTPRLSLSKVSGKDLSYGWVKDVLLATSYEDGRSRIKAYLYGGAVDLNVPGFTFLNSHFYVRDNPNLSDDTWQITLTWKRPFTMGGLDFVAEGFADFAGNAGPTYAANQFIVPRLLMDAGHFVGAKKGKFWVGMEYSYWHNKFGIDGKTESVPQLQLKWVL